MLPQLVAYWEKTFKIDLFKPQIGVVNVTDVSIPHENLLRHPEPAPFAAMRPCVGVQALIKRVGPLALPKQKTCQDGPGLVSEPAATYGSTVP